jgi:hypothetical protein
MEHAMIDLSIILHPDVEDLFNAELRDALGTRLVSERNWLAARVSCEEAGMNNTEFFIDGPIGLLYYAGPAWTLLAIVIFLALLIARMNRP